MFKIFDTKKSMMHEGDVTYTFTLIHDLNYKELFCDNQPSYYLNDLPADLYLQGTNENQKK